MATTFERVGTSVLVTIGGAVYSLPAKSAIFPDARRATHIIICDEYNVQRESEGLPIEVADVTGIANTGRNDLIRKLAEQFFFEPTSPMVRLTNRTGAPSVKGTIVTASTEYDNAFDINPADIPKAMGVVFDSGIADGAECYVVTGGVAEVLLQDNTSATRGYWAKVSDTVSGRADITNLYPPGGTISALEDHSSEIGHCIQSVTAGENKLARCVLHFN